MHEKGEFEVIKYILPIASVCGLLVLSGCSVKYKVVGGFDDYNEVFIGNVDHNLLAGTGHIEATGQQSKMKCTGDSYVTYIPPASLGCAGQRGKAPMRCTDGRRLDVEWIATSCTTGHGEGKDQNGATFRFAFGLKEEEAQARLKELSAEVSSNPELPVYRPKEVRKEKGYSTGTGFFVTNTGIMVTNHHVIEDAKNVYVLDTTNGKKFTAEVLATDPINDVAVIKIEAQSKGIPLASYFTSPKGDEVLTLGYPLIALQGQEQKATFGRINSLSGIKDDIRMVQIDVPIQPGNSGGPLLNNKGEAVGVITATLDQIVTLRESGSLPQNVNFAVKIDYILPALRKALGGAIPSISDNASTMKMSQIVSLRESSVMLVVAE